MLRLGGPAVIEPLIVLLVLFIAAGMLLGWWFGDFVDQATWTAWRRRRPSLDMCEVCGARATHELGSSSFNAATGEGSGMVACYCRRHKPEGAVRVR